MMTNLKILPQTKGYHDASKGLLQIIFIALLMGCSHDGCEVPINCNYQKAADTYTYPVKPGTPEWVNLNTTEARWEACQIPQDKLKSMSTAGLIDSWCDFPFTIEIYLSTSFQRPINFLMTHFSGLQELCLRNDAGIKLLERYKKMNPACVTGYKDEKTEWNEKSKGDFILSFPPVELLLAQDTILNKLNPGQKKDLVKEALLKYQEKKQYPELFSIKGGTAFPLLICVRTLKNAGYQPFIEELESKESQILTIFFDTGELFTDNSNAPEIQNIVKHAENFLR